MEHGGPVLLPPFFLSAHSLAFGERSGSAPLSLPGASGSDCRQSDAGLQPRHSGRLAGTQTSLGALLRGGATTGWQRGARTYLALEPQS